MVTIISLGGSIVVPDLVDEDFLREFSKLVRGFVKQGNKLILIVGGGAPARRYQQAYRRLVQANRAVSDSDQDWIGIMATRLNAELVRGVFSDICTDPVVYNPTGDVSFSGSVLVAAGWKPGFSTDFDAVVLAERFNAQRVINLSNIEKVYSADPKVDPEAVPLDFISWKNFRKMVGDDWAPGKNLPFDPIASKKAEELNLEVIAAGGKDLENISAILDGRDFFGTRIAASN